MSKGNMKKSNNQIIFSTLVEILKLDNYRKLKKFHLAFLEYAKQSDLFTDKTLLRFKDCGNCLVFKINEELLQSKLEGGIFCHNRFCPICSKMYTLKEARSIATVLNYVAKQGYQYLFLTLTTPNVKADLLSDEITKLNKGIERLMKLKQVKSVIHGYIRKIEVTYNQKRNDFNPHVHMILAVRKSYFGKRYIPRETWLELWRQSVRDDTIQNVHITRVKMDDIKDVMEIAKYSAKHGDLLKNQDVFNTLVTSLKGRLLITFNGVFKEARKLYNEGKIQPDLETILYTKRIFLRWCNNNHEYVDKVYEYIVNYDYKVDDIEV